MRATAAPSGIVDGQTRGHTDQWTLVIIEERARPPAMPSKNMLSKLTVSFTRYTYLLVKINQRYGHFPIVLASNLSVNIIYTH